MDACPIGYNPIMNTADCEAAANEFRYVWDEHLGIKDTNSVCNYCTGCSPNVAQLSSDHGAEAFWFCKKGE